MESATLLRCCIAFLAICASPAHVKASDQDALEELIDILDDPEQYNNDIMPFNQSGPLVVKLQMFLRNVEVDDNDMTTTVEMTFRMLWTDDRLSYATPDVEYVNIVDTSKLWLPDPFFKNAIETNLLESVHPEGYARSTASGEITYSHRLRLTLRCNMDLARFPHDKQTCPILVASYAYNEDLVEFIMDSDVAIAEDLIYRSRFSMGDIETSSCESTTKTGTYSCVQVDMNLEREASTYSMEFYIPFIFLVIIAFFSEVIPAGALLPRLLLTLVPLLTLASFYFAYSLNLPAVSYARASDIFAGISLLVIFALLVHTILAYYRSLLDNVEKKRKDTEGVEEHSDVKDPESQVDTTNMTKMQFLRHQISMKFDFIFRATIVAFYAAFLFFYFVAYTM